MTTGARPAAPLADAVFGLYVPARTPPAVVEKLNALVNRALQTPAVRDGIVAIGSVPEPLTPAEFGQKAAADFVRLGAIIRERNIRAD